MTNSHSSSVLLPFLVLFGLGSSGRAADFSSDIRPILTKHCISCHGPRKQLGGFRADNRDDFFGKNGKEAFIVPGKSSESKLIEIISGRRPTMKSADAHILPAEDIRTITKWIDEGADWPQD